MTTQTKPSTFKAGDRVSAMQYGTRKTGFIRNIGNSGKIVFVQWDNSALPTWMHLTSLTKEEKL